MKKSKELSPTNEGKKFQKDEVVALIVELAIILILLVKCFMPLQQFSMNAEDVFLCGASWENEDKQMAYAENWDNGGEYVMLYQVFSLPSDAYRLDIKYKSSTSKDYIDELVNGPSANSESYAGKVVTRVEDNMKLIRVNDLELIDSKYERSTNFWLRQYRGTSDVTVYVYFENNGRLEVSDITVTSIRSYRFVRLFEALGFFVLLNLFYLVFFENNHLKVSKNKKYEVAGLSLISLFICAPYFADFLFSGHDLSFHLSRIATLGQALAEGQIPQRMQFHMMNDYGYATPLFYGEILLVIPAILYNLQVPLQNCYKVYVILVNIATVLISYWSFSRILYDYSKKKIKEEFDLSIRSKAMFVTAIYTLSAYRLTNLFIRSALGEYSAMMFFPLFIYGMYHIYQKDKTDKMQFSDMLPIIISATGLVQTHVLSCEMVVWFTLIFVLCNLKKTFQKNVICTLVISAIVIVLLNIWYLVPFIQSMSMDMEVCDKETINLIEQSSLYLTQIFGVFHTAHGFDVTNGVKEEMPLALGAPFVIMFFATIFMVIYLKEKDEELQQGLFLCVVALFMVSNLCPWDSLKPINEEVARIAGMVQFPWRYLAIATVLVAVTSLFVLKKMDDVFPKKVSIYVMCIGLLFMFISEGYFFTSYLDQQSEFRVYNWSDIGDFKIVNGEYLLTGTSEYSCHYADVQAGNEVVDTEFYYEDCGYVLNCKNESAYENYVMVPVTCYDNYEVSIAEIISKEGMNVYVGKVLEHENGSNNRIQFNIPGNFEGSIRIAYKVPVLWRVCELISVVTLLGMIVTGIVSKKRK